MMMGCPMMTGSGGPMSTFTEGRIAFLKAELSITDAQKSVWDAYAEAIKRNLQSMQNMWQIMRTARPRPRLSAWMPILAQWRRGLRHSKM
jgi:hypothetical protein